MSSHSSDKLKGSLADIPYGSELVLIRLQPKMAFLRSAVLVQALLLTIEFALAKPIPLIARQTIEDQYDFVICGGSCCTTSFDGLLCAIASLVLTFNLSQQVEQLDSSSQTD